MECSYFLPISPEQALEECQRLNMERFNLNLIPIPAEGGCVIAIVPLEPQEKVIRSRWGEMLAALRQRRAVGQAITKISQAIAPRVAAYR